MLGDLMTSVQPIEVKIFGTDQNKLKALSVYGKYYGSSTRINGIGTIYYQNTQEIIRIKIRYIYTSK